MVGTAQWEVVPTHFGGGFAQLPGRRVSSFAFEPDWRSRPWPPRDKYERPAPSDATLGLV